MPLDRDRALTMPILELDRPAMHKRCRVDAAVPYLRQLFEKKPNPDLPQALRHAMVVCADPSQQPIDRLRNLRLNHCHALQDTKRAAPLPWLLGESGGRADAKQAPTQHANCIRLIHVKPTA